MDISEYEKETFEGTIAQVIETDLKDWLERRGLSENAIAQWSNLEREHVCLVIKSGETKIYDQFLKPTLQGYGKSNIKKLIKNNPNLPKKTEDWVGKKVKLVVDGNFLRVAL